MLEDVKEILKNESDKCDNVNCDVCGNKMNGCPDQNLEVVEIVEDIVKEVNELYPRKLVIPGIYRHFKHTEDGIPNNYMYAVRCVSKPISKIDLNKSIRKGIDIVKSTCYFQYTETDENNMSFLIDGKWVHCEDFSKEDLVIYTPLYNDHKPYARPYNMFMEEVPEGRENPNEQRYRFELVRY